MAGSTGCSPPFSVCFHSSLKKSGGRPRLAPPARPAPPAAGAAAGGAGCCAKAATAGGSSVPGGVRLRPRRVPAQAAAAAARRPRPTTPRRQTGSVHGVRQAVGDGTIDVIATDLAPRRIDEKERAFAHTPYGIVG